MSRLTAALGRLNGTKAWRVWTRYGSVHGNVLAGGIAFFAFFSLFPALTLGFTVFGVIVGGRVDLQEQVARWINDSFGATLIGTSPGEGVVRLDQLDQVVSSDVLTVTGLVGMVVLLFTGLGWVGALRGGVGAVFDRHDKPNPVVAKALDLGVLGIVGLSVLVSVVASLFMTAATGSVLDWLGLDRTRWAAVLVSVSTALVLLAIDTGLFVLLFRVLSGVRPVLDDLYIGALVGAVGLGLLKLGGGVLLRLSSGNRFLAAFSIVVGLLIWMNVAARFTLLAASWAATTVADRGHLASGELLGAAPAERSTSASVEPAPCPPATALYGQRAADRTTLVAGAVLGATAAVGAGVLGRAGLALLGGFRHDDG